MVLMGFPPPHWVAFIYFIPLQPFVQQMVAIFDGPCSGTMGSVIEQGRDPSPIVLGSSGI